MSKATKAGAFTKTQINNVGLGILLGAGFIGAMANVTKDALITAKNSIKESASDFVEGFKSVKP